MTNKFQQLQNTLNTLFQTNQEDLDFGIYKIMNQKRSEIDSFLNHDLKTVISKGLSQLKNSDSANLQKEIEEAKKAALQAGLENPDEAPKVIELKKQLSQNINIDDVENEIYSHLTNFFKRYYQEGDFISQRRYKKDAYAIPYQGEEVKLHWANHDQYYIKTAENFSNYSFKLPSEKTVTFRLVEASTERDNNKAKPDDERKFKLAEGEFIKEDRGILNIYFEYLPLGKKPSQTKLLEEAFETLKTNIPEDFSELLKADPSKSNKNRTALEKRLKEYTAKNTFDYFIHKDLGGFLRREIDFYIKNELLHIDDIGIDINHNKEVFTKIHVFKNIARKVIDFLEQIEEFQRKLWEKKKFVTHCDYLITLNHIDQAHYEAIAANSDQIDAWVELGFMDKLTKVDKDYLKKSQYITVDTKYFPDLKNELLSDIDQLDEKTNGVLINSENWQALNLIKSKHKNNIDLIYIDPPYNTSENTFVYKNQYKHSSWISMMNERILQSTDLVSTNGVLEVAIDDTEAAKLKLILDNIYGASNYLGTFAVQVNPAGQNIRPNAPALSHDYFIVYAKEIDKSTLNSRPLTDEEINSYPEEDEKGRFYWDNLRRRGGNSRPTDRPNQSFPLYINPESKKISTIKFKDSQEVWPVDSKGIERIWRYNKEGVVKEIKKNEIELVWKANEWRISKKSRMPEGKMPKTMWYKSNYSATSHGTILLQNLFGESPFSYPKSIHLVKDAIYHWSKQNSFIIDYFAGSGTTGHAVIKLNNEDSGDRKYILVEMGLYFDSVLKPRIQKVIYSDNWKDGKPEDSNGVSQIVKYLKLESYEDTLNNLQLTTSEGQQSLLATNSSFKEDYFLHYMLDVESRGSDSLLNADKLDKPFDYSLLLTSEGKQYRKTVDLPETFNYLIGLKVASRTFNNNCLVFIGQQHLTDKKVAVIWRDIEVVNDKNLGSIIDSLDKTIDLVYVNGQPTIKTSKFNIEPIAPEFKQRMFS